MVPVPNTPNKFTINVANTLTAHLLTTVPSKPLLAEACNATFDAATASITDTKIYPADQLVQNPFGFTLKTGVEILAEAAPGKGLTWGVLGNALVGLKAGLVFKGNFVEASWEVYDGQAGLVGLGNVTATG